MLAVRRLLALALFGVVAAAFASPAGAARPGGYPDVLTTPHFEVHYTGGPTPAGITHQQAGDLAAMAEHAYTTLVTGWGYPAPLNDGDGRTDIWVEDHSLLGIPGLLGYAEQDTPGTTSTGWFTLDVTAIASQAVVAHELMHVIQYGIWTPTDDWLLEGTAEWAGFNVSDFKPFGGSIPATVGAPDMSLDCVSLACGVQGNGYEVGGYSRWTFFQYLSERYGTGIVRDAFVQGASNGSPTQTGLDLLSAALVAKGTTLSDLYNEYTFTHIASNYQVAALKGFAPAAYRELATGSETMALPVQTVPVNHLATRYLRLTRGGNTGTCYAATLSLTVALPAGVTSRPSLYWKALGTAPLQLNVNGSTASIKVPWDTCTGGQYGYLALPNPSLTLDAQVFTVSGSLTVDKSTVVSPVGPPLPIYTGPSSTAGGDIAPAIKVYGAQLIRVSSGTRKVRLIVFASGPGKLQVAAGGTTLGTYSLRAGNNDLRFRLPLKTVRALRSTSRARAANSVLTLTSLSTAGAKGKTVTRRLVVSKPTSR